MGYVGIFHQCRIGRVEILHRNQTGQVRKSPPEPHCPRRNSCPKPPWRRWGAGPNRRVNVGGGVSNRAGKVGAHIWALSTTLSNSEYTLAKLDIVLRNDGRRVPTRRVPPRRIPPETRKAADSPAAGSPGGFPRQSEKRRVPPSPSLFPPS